MKDIKIRIEGDVSPATAMELVAEVVDGGAPSDYNTTVFTMDGGDKIAVWPHSTPTMDVFRVVRKKELEEDPCGDRISEELDDVSGDVR